MWKTPDETSLAYYEFCKDRFDADMVFWEADLIPAKIPAGSEVNHRIRYAICKASDLNMKQENGGRKKYGEIIRKVYFGRKPVFEDQAVYEFKQGGWIVDAFIMAPNNAAPGKYQVDTIISYNGKSSMLSNTFEVKKKGEE